MTAAGFAVSKSPSKGLHIGLWIAQGLLALMFLGVGSMKLFTPAEELAKVMPVENGLSLIRFIGLSELLGGLGLLLPAATRIKPWLTPLAALGLLVIMVLAALTHLAAGEYASIGINVVIGAVAAFVIWGRWKKAPIEAR